MGAVPYDEYVRRAIQRQIAVVEAYPAAPASLAFKTIAAKADKWQMPKGARGHVEFFVERLLQGGGAAAAADGLQ
jgi:flagellar biosynthesis protein FlhG